MASIVNTEPRNNMLQNPGFEDGLDGWAVSYGGNFTQVGEPVKSGTYAASLSITSINDEWIYQTVPVVPDGSYNFSGWAMMDAPEHTSVYLQISWYESEDGYGEISHIDSSTILKDNLGNYTLLTTGDVQAYPNERSAR
ncbi:MAG: carbohydrate binding domain-containing protein [Dehalococcoidia bacterium]|nr:MAG: carbohydrate binding domain-containing protein [Dehalococcoidia bacterium]